MLDGDLYRSVANNPTSDELDGHVDVVSVRTQVVRGKVKRFGRNWGKRPNWKKAIVTLKDGENIEFFENE